MFTARSTSPAASWAPDGDNPVPSKSGAMSNRPDPWFNKVDVQHKYYGGVVSGVVPIRDKYRHTSQACLWYRDSASG